MSEDWGDLLDADRQALAAWAQNAVVPVEPAPALRRRLLATLGTAERFRPFFELLRRSFDLGADGLTELLRRIDASGGWQEAPMPGVRYFHFQAGPALAGFETGVVRLAPGATFARHRHRGPERTFVLDGFVEDGGRVHGPGSMLEMPGGSAHAYSARPGRDLIVVSMHTGIDFEPG
jgi:quercetin dioxygenase-like cupin family protein